MCILYNKKPFRKFRIYRIDSVSMSDCFSRWKRRLGRSLFTLCIALVPMCTDAAQKPDLPPHLIQSVQDKDIYEGMAALNMMQCPALEEPDCDLAYEKIKNSVVRIQMGNAHGSGIIWEMTPQMLVIATNGHVLEYWDDSDSYVYFPQGYYADARVIGISGQYDVGFVSVDVGQFDYAQLLELRSVPVDETVYSGLEQGSLMFSVDCASGTDGGQFYEGTVEDVHKYIEDLGAYMLYGHGFAKEGMSGGGTFDGRGYLIGMTTGGTVMNETASVPLPDIIEAYGEITAGFRTEAVWR